MKRAIIFTLIMICSVFSTNFPLSYAHEVTMEKVILDKDHKSIKLTDSGVQMNDVIVRITNTGKYMAHYRFRYGEYGWWSGEIAAEGGSKSVKIKKLKNYSIQLISLKGHSSYSWWVVLFGPFACKPGAEVTFEILKENGSEPCNK